ncbi:hypothetical protein [Pseudomonas amygdali]|uniref:hypothetical protein n=1 Tax=Pseudomonas amygdali TaxID=47877 RepID=UPI0011C4794F|nr:hypothetical protein [Pseudomonas amygdali]
MSQDLSGRAFHIREYYEALGKFFADAQVLLGLIELPGCRQNPFESVTVQAQVVERFLYPISASWGHLVDCRQENRQGGYYRLMAGSHLFGTLRGDLTNALASQKVLITNRLHAAATLAIPAEVLESDLDVSVDDLVGRDGCVHKFTHLLAKCLHGYALYSSYCGRWI